MSEELQKEIDRLKSENAKLSGDLKAAAAARPDRTADPTELSKARGEAKERRLALKQLREEFETLKKERDAGKADVSKETEGLKSQLAQLQGQLRDVRHKDAFLKVAHAHKVSDPTKLSDLYALSGYKAESEQPDVAKLGEVIKATLKGRPHLLDSAEESARTGSGGPRGVTKEDARKVETKRAPGSDRGQSTTTESSSAAQNRVPGRL